MNLLIDSGNTSIKWALMRDGSPMEVSSCLSKDASRLHEIWERCDVPHRVIVANVAGGRVADEIGKAVNVLWQLDAEFILSSQYCCGLTNSYDDPEKLGVDRWMAMVAAYQMKDGPVIVIDCGTAVTIDLVNEKGVCLGGVIMPGLNLAFQCLNYGTDAIDTITSDNSMMSSLSLSTQDAVAAGVLLGLAGGIEKVIMEQALSVDATVAVLITGGDAVKVMPYLTTPVEYHEDIVLLGLKFLADQTNRHSE